MFESSTPDELLAVVEDVHRQEAVLMARKLAAVAQLLSQRIEEELAIEVDATSLITGFARTTAEVSAAMNMTPAGARRVVTHAEALDCRLPRIAALLAAGSGRLGHCRIGDHPHGVGRRREVRPTGLDAG